MINHCSQKLYDSERGQWVKYSTNRKLYYVYFVQKYGRIFYEVQNLFILMSCKNFNSIRINIWKSDCEKYDENNKII